MPTIDERVVSMAFENQVFEQRVSVTMSTLSKLDTAVRNIGGTSGFDKIEAQASKVTLQSPMSALDKLKAKLGGASTGAAEGLGGIDRAGNKVTLEGPTKAVDKLQGKMGQLSAGSTFTDIENAANRTNFQGLISALDGIKGHLSGIQTAAAVAFGNLASQAAQKGLGFAKGFAFAPIMDGLHEYETNLQAIQTIQANTDQPLTKINASLNELNRYSDQTIYNFGEMAKNIGTFTAAGVDLKTATSSIKGIANMAALSGSNSQQASTAMYQLSQAIASGKVGLQDWNSVVNAGMGGKKLQSALATTAVAMGDIGKNSVKLEGPLKKLTINGQSFRESIMAKPGETPWLSSDVLVNTLATLDGRFSKAALSAEMTKDGLKKYTSAQVEAKIATNRTALEQKNGVKYTDAQFAALMKLSDSAFKSATEVKTLGQVFDVAKETIGSGWSASFQSIFGNLKEAKKTFTELSGAINGMINANSMARNKMLHDWKELGGRTLLIRGIKTAFQDIIAVLKPVKDAFRDIFPAKTGQDLVGMTRTFTKLMETLKPSLETVDNLRRIFGGLFAVIHIGWTIIKEFVGVIFDLLGVIGKGSGGFLGFVAGIGDFLVAADTALTKGGLLKELFKGIETVLRAPLTILGKVSAAIMGLFQPSGGGQSRLDFLNELNQFGRALTPAERLVNNFKAAWQKLVDEFNAAKSALEPWFSIFADKLNGIGDVLTNAFKGLNFERIMQGLQVGFTGGIFLVLKKALGGGDGGFLSALTKPLEGVTQVLGGVTGQLEAMQSKLHAETLLAIAASLAVLAGGIFVLSTINADDLAKAMTAVAIGLGELMGAMKLMTAGMGKLGVLQLPVIAAGMIGLATAVVILSGAMKIFATMSWQDIAKGLVGVAGSLAGVGLSMKLMPSGPSMVIQAAGITLLAVAMNLLAFAVTTFSQLSWEELVRGLAGVVGSIVGIGAAVDLLPPTLPLTAAGLVLLGIGLSAIAGAVKVFGGMDIFKLVQGLMGMMLAIAGIGLAVAFIPPTLPLTAAGLVIVGEAMVVMAGAIGLMGSLGIATLVKGIVALGATLVVLAVGLTLMSGTLPGSAALLAVSAALAVLAPTLGLLGTMKWSTIFKGLAAIALALGTLAVVGLLAAGPISSLGVSLLPLAAVFVLTAGAVFIFAKALSLLGANGGKGIAVMITAITAFVALIPTLVISFVKGIVSIADQIVVLAPKIISALDKILTTVIAFIIAEAPKLALAIGAIITAVIQVVGENSPKLQAAGFKLLQDLLAGMSQNIGEITRKGSDIILKFLNAVTAKAPALVAAGVRTLVAFLQGITSKISTVVATVANMVLRFISALSRNVPKIIGAGQDMMIKFIAAIAGYVPKLMTKGVDIVISFLNGIERAIPRLRNQAISVARTFLRNLADGLVQLADIGFNAIIRFLNGLARAIRQNSRQLADAGANVANAIIDAMIQQFGRLGGVLRHALEAVFRLLPGWARKILGISSPSKVFLEIGQQTMQGMALGLSSGGVTVERSMANVADGVISTAKTTLGNVPNLLDGLMDMDPVISPVLDLSSVEQEASKLASLIPTSMITATASFDQAALISSQTAALAVAPIAPTAAPTSVTFEQNNYSPDPLSNIEIYRQTNNQISRIKTLIGVP
jgi:tape measure domain-containing protein